jgi:hypothetical protein
MATIRVYSMLDSFINSSAPGADNSVATIINVQWSGGTENQEALMKWDLSGIPAGSVVNSAIAHFYGNRSGGTDKNVRTYALTVGWAENVNWNTVNRGSYDGGTNRVLDLDPLGWSFYSNFDLLSYVQNWVSGAWANNGLLFTGGGGAGSYNTWYSREGGANAPYMDIDYTVPNAAPNAPGLSTPTNGGLYNTGSPTVSWTFSDPDARDYQGAWAVHIIRNSDNAVVRDTGWVAGGAQSWVISPALPTDTYRYTVITQDSHGVAGPWSWEPVFYVDVTPPSTPSLSGPAYTAGGNYTVNWTYNDWHAQGWYQYQISLASDFSTIAGDTGQIASAQTSFTETRNQEGTWYHRVRVWDSVGNLSAWSNTVTIIVDKTVPSMGAPSPQQYTIGTTATVYVDGITDGFSGMNHVQVYQVRPDGSYYDIGNATAVGGNRYSINVTGLNIEGNWHFDFRAYDTAGNGSGPVAAYVMHDTSLPVIGSGDGDRYSNINSGTIRHTVNN